MHAQWGKMFFGGEYSNLHIKQRNKLKIIVIIYLTSFDQTFKIFHNCTNPTVCWNTFLG